MMLFASDCYHDTHVSGYRFSAHVCGHRPHWQYEYYTVILSNDLGLELMLELQTLYRNLFIGVVPAELTLR
jgi:hypothetical protein